MFESGEASSIKHPHVSQPPYIFRYFGFWSETEKRKKNGSMRLNTEFHIFVSVLGNLVISHRDTLSGEEDGD